MIYRKQALTYISTHAKDQKEIEEKTYENSKNNQIKLLYITQYLTVAKLCDLDLNRKCMSRASICKKNQLNRSYETQVMFKRSLNMNLNKIRNLKISKS